MYVVVIIPVGPGHAEVSGAALKSVEGAWANHHGPFHKMEVVRIYDLDGAMGRSAVRNRGMDVYPADWHFLLDADDEMVPDAFACIDRKFVATFGTVYLRSGGGGLGQRARYDRHPVTRETLFMYGALGTLSMGFFVRGNLDLRFDERLDVGEDFDYYVRLPGFTKVSRPLVTIGYRTPSAGGPRSSANCDWVTACNEVIERYR